MQTNELRFRGGSCWHDHWWFRDGDSEFATGTRIDIERDFTTCDEKGNPIYHYECSCGWTLDTAKLADVKKHIEEAHGILMPKFKRTKGDTYLTDRGEFHGTWEVCDGHTITKSKWKSSTGGYTSDFTCSCGWAMKDYAGTNAPAIQHAHRITVKGVDRTRRPGW